MFLWHPHVGTREDRHKGLAQEFSPRSSLQAIPEVYDSPETHDLVQARSAPVPDHEAQSTDHSPCITPKGERYLTSECRPMLLVPTRRSTAVDGAAGLTRRFGWQRLRGQLLCCYILDNRGLFRTLEETPDDAGRSTCATRCQAVPHAEIRLAGPSGLQ